MNRSEKIRFYYGIFLAVLTAAMGISFIIAVTVIYFGGKANGPVEAPYTPERIGDNALVPLIILCLWVVAVIVGYVLSVIYPTSPKAKKQALNEFALLKRLKANMSSSGGEEFLANKRSADRYRKIRTSVWTAAFAVMLAASVAIIVDIFTRSNYVIKNATLDIMYLLRNAIYWFAAGLFACIAAVAVEVVTVKKELNFVKEAIKTGDRSKRKEEIKRKTILIATVGTMAAAVFSVVLYIIAPSLFSLLIGTGRAATIAIVIIIIIATIAAVVCLDALKKYLPEKSDKLIRTFTRIAVGVVSVAFIIAGAFNGGADDVLLKAINICTECIGLG